MPTFKNLYKMPVSIYFGDIRPDAIFHHDKINQHVFIDRHDYGPFTPKQFEDIKGSWKAWCDSHFFDHDRYRWYQDPA